MHFDTSIFHPHVSSYRFRSLQSLYRRFKSDKKREYGNRVNRIEPGSFTYTPYYFQPVAGWDKEVTVMIKELASELAVKRDESYSHVINWLC